MDYHKNPQTIIRISDVQKERLRKIVAFYGFKSMSEMIGNLLNYGFSTNQSEDKNSKIAIMLSDFQTGSLKQVLENGESRSTFTLSKSEILTLVKMIRQEFGEGLLYRMCECKKNDIDSYLDVAVEPWLDMIQGKFYEIYQIPVRKQDVRIALRQWFSESTTNGDFKAALEGYLSSIIVKKLSDRNNKDKQEV